MSVSIPIWLGLAQTIWAASYVAIKYSLAEMPVGAVVFLRMGIASLGFMVLWLFRPPPKFAIRDLLVMGGLGALNFFIAQMLQFTALRYTQAIDASILVVFEPLITVAMAFLIVKERATRATWIALGVGMVGMGILSKGGTAAEGGVSLGRLFGNFLFLLSLTSEGICSASGKIYANRYGAISSMGIMIMSGFLVGSVVNFPTIRSVDLAFVSLRAWGSIALLGLGASLLSYSIWYHAIRRAPIQQAALSLLLQPVIGTFFGFVLLGESVGFGTLLGAGMIISSLVWWHLRS